MLIVVLIYPVVIKTEDLSNCSNKINSIILTNAQLKCAAFVCAVNVYFWLFIFIKTEIIKTMNSYAHFLLNYFYLECRC